MKKNVPARLSTKEFSKYTGLSVSMVTKLLRMGQVSGEKRSGRWMIPEDQLQIKRVVDLSSSSLASKKHLSDPNVISVKIIPSKKDYSVTEFSKITYLTEFGVKEWLRLGKIKGHQNKKGHWRVDANSLDIPNLQHLLRK
jgi:hypothetical protein